MELLTSRLFPPHALTVNDQVIKQFMTMVHVRELLTGQQFQLFPLHAPTVSDQVIKVFSYVIWEQSNSSP